MILTKLIVEAREWIGTPWHHGQALKGVGCDCIGFILGAAQAVGLLPNFNPHEPRFRGYGLLPNPSLMYSACDEFMDRISPLEATAGDVFLMRFENDPQHFALISQENPRQIIHAYTSIGKVVEHGVDAAWTERILRAYRFRGVD